MENYLHKAKEYFYHLHMYPELSNEEYQTTEYIINILEQFDCFKLDKRTETGVVAIYNPGCAKTIAFRADIDALPIQETTNLEYASKNNGVMHACGHDFHTANLLGFALWLANQQLNITIKLIFQHCEEVTPGGSRHFIDNGVLDDVDHVFGLHVDSELKTGSIGIKSGALYASMDDFDITILGQGGHISTPHLVKDPLFCTTAIISELQNSVSRRIDPMNPPLIGVGSLIYGNRIHNIINDEAFFCGTLRTHNETTRAKSIEYIDNLVINMVNAYGLEADIKWEFGEPVLSNDIVLTKNISDYLNSKNKYNIITLEQAKFGGEDFSNYATIKPSLFLLLGAYTNEYDLHNSNMVVDLDALEYGLNLFIDVASYFNQV